MIHYTGTPEIETERLLLRRMLITDAEKAFHHWLSDERVADHRVSAAHQAQSETIDRVTKIVNDYAKKDFCWWGIERQSDGELIGEIDLYDFQPDTGNCEVSYTIGYEWWGKEYGTEALKAVVEFGFLHMNVHKISAAHNTDNPASGRLMIKAGMVQEGTIRHMIRNAKNQYKDCAVYGLLQEDYLKISKGAHRNIQKLII